MSEGRSWLVTLVLGVGLVLATMATVGLIWLTEPEPEREAAVKRTAMLVEVTTVEQGTFQPVLTALGSVRAAEDVTLQPRVAGQVRALSERFVPGQVVEAGTVLVELDPADAQNALAQARSDLQLAEADLALERGRQAVARTERDNIRGAISPEQERLVLREPQLQAAEANVVAAEAAVKQAELELARTRVRAPSRSLVLRRGVGVGSLVSTNTALGRLVAVSQFWVELTVPTRQLRYIPDDALVHLRDRAAWTEGQERLGRVSGVVRELDDTTRLARLLVTVDDPLALDSDAPVLTAGAYVEARIEARELVDVVRLPRALLRKGETVWALEDGVLRIHPVEVVLEDAEYAYLAAGLASDSQVVATDLSTVKDGAPLRTSAESP